MSTPLIKRGSDTESIGRIRPILRDAAAVPVSVRDPELNHFEQEMGRLEVELADSRRLIEEAQQAHKAALVVAREEGFQDGLKEAVRNEEEAITLLGGAIDEAVAKIDEQLAGAERLAALMARECLDRIFGDDENRVHLLHEIIANQLRQLEQGSVVAIALSHDDIPELSNLASLEPLAGPAVKFIHRAELKRGEIAIDLTLGSLSVGLDQQWGRLRGALTELAEGTV